MKRFISFVLAVLTAVSVMSVVSLPVAANREGIYTFNIVDGKAEIISCDKSQVPADFVIPTTLGGCPVTKIGNNAFAGVI